MPGCDLAGSSHTDALGPPLPTLAWSVPTGQATYAAESENSPIMGLHGDIFIAPTLGINGSLQRLDAASGAVLWALPLSGGGAGPPFAAGADDVLCGDGAGGVHRLAALTGAVVWSVVLPSPAVSVLATGSTVLASLPSGSLQALDFATGALLWAWEACSGPLPCAYHNPRAFRPALATASGASPCPPPGCDTVYLVARATPGGQPGFLAALSAHNGTERWRWQVLGGASTQYYSGAIVAAGRLLYTEGLYVHARSAATGAPLYTVSPSSLTDSNTLGYTPVADRDGSALYAALPGAGLFALHAPSGSTLWSRGFSVYFGAGALDGGGLLFTTDYSGTLRALHTATGASAWELPLGPPSAGFAATSSLALGPQRTLAALSSTLPPSLLLIGRRQPLTPPSVWPMLGGDLPGTSHCAAAGCGPPASPPPTLTLAAPTAAVYTQGSPVLGARGELFLTGDAGAVRCLDAATGAQRWAFAAAANVVAPPCLAGGGTDVLAADWGGTVYRLDAGSGALLWTAQASAARISAALLVAGGRVLVLDGLAVLRALDLDTGALLWAWDPCAALGSAASPCGLSAISAYLRPALAQADGASPCPAEAAGGCDTVFLAVPTAAWGGGGGSGGAALAAVPGAVAALAAATGALRWLRPFPQPPSTFFFSGPAVGGGRLLLSNCTHILALAAATGEPLFAAPALGQPPPGPDYSGDSPPPLLLPDGSAVFSAQPGGPALRLSSSTGAVQWASSAVQRAPNVDTGGGALSSSAGAGAESVLYLPGARATVWALSAATGAVLWGVGVGAAPGDSRILSSLALGPNGTLATVLSGSSATVAVLRPVAAPAPAPAPGGTPAAAAAAAAAAVPPGGIAALALAGAALCLCAGRLAALRLAKGWARTLPAPPGSINGPVGEGRGPGSSSSSSSSLLRVEMGTSTADLEGEEGLLMPLLLGGGGQAAASATASASASAWDGGSALLGGASRASTVLGGGGVLSVASHASTAQSSASAASAGPEGWGAAGVEVQAAAGQGGQVEAAGSSSSSYLPPSSVVAEQQQQQRAVLEGSSAATAWDEEGVLAFDFCAEESVAPGQAVAAWRLGEGGGPGGLADGDSFVLGGSGGGSIEQ